MNRNFFFFSLFLLFFFQFDSDSLFKFSANAQNFGFPADEIEGPADKVEELYVSECAVCHGVNLLGAALGPPLVGSELFYGDSIPEISENTSKGFSEKGMPAFSSALSQNQINALALFISEKRQGTDLDDFKYDMPLEIPQGIVQSEHHNFVLDIVATNLDPLPFSIAPLPDGRILLTEKKHGLSFILIDGSQSDYIEGSPKGFSDSIKFGGQEWGLGWVMDVAIHPEYESNGWIYLHYGDRCEDCNQLSRQAGHPVSMNKLVRGRIRDGYWVDEQVIWSADKETYSMFPEIAAGGRIAFDGKGYVYISVGAKGSDEYIGIQDLSLPYGKIHRVHDDGRTPLDNPFINNVNALETIWSYGHRNPQGLEFDNQKDQLWSTEMGPRGGDELNLIVSGRNYGWPLFSKGVNYDGSPIDYGKKLDIQFSLDDIEQPVLDLTPAPAISSFIFYKGQKFPKWKNNILAGSLRATDLFRIELRDNKVVHIETMLEDLARFRDIETNQSGDIYILMEHSTGGMVLRMKNI